MLISAPPTAAPLSSLHSLSSQHFLLPAQFLPPGVGNGGRPLRRGDLAIRMGGGPRTYPGGVSKWQWKRMQAKKAQQLLKARLARERQLFEMRKRVELRDAVAHLERPWDPDSSSAAAPTLLSVAADDQLKALADRFHRPGGVDLWNDRDGPRVFESPASGAASARFFPKNAVHSVQPYALRGDADEAGAPPVTRANAADVLLALGGHSVHENAPEEETYGNGDHAPAVEFMERDGTWEPLHALDDGNDSNPADWSSADDDDFVTYESESTGDVGSWREQQAIVKRNGRSAMVRWEGTAVSRDGDTGWSGDAFFSDADGTRQGHSDQRWQQRSRGSRKHAGARWNALDTMAGGGTRERDRAVAGSISESEMIQNGSVPKWRTRSKDGTKRGTGRRSVPGEDWVSDGFNSNSDSARGSKLEPSWGAQNKLNGRGNFRDRLKPKVNGKISNGDAPRRHTRSNNADEHTSSNNGDGRHRFGGGSPKDLEAPTWKPRRMNRARNNNGAREDKLGGTFRRGDNGAARQLQNPQNANRDGGRRIGRNGGRQFRGDDYSLRPTSELQNFCEGSD
ncbi:hypothetical protein PR202_gb08819 [Eleusine coracana subsp. coracana]|uniref:Uncharacterized protein n=1 Tax=Eleusine coracana subsp. coracana TaxID=191504 RepID=A0AAV5EFC8_ELECO|nr:hypothetical protein QOZ80_2BG0189880 [Eleusine coracana subsp. coracana]GJN21350.1 hypothetical protein PR202_gb08819 [Eleusine coracana subsp. coracana]